jgi:hypothetical protein
MIFSTNMCDTFLILRGTEQNMIENVYWPFLKYLLFLSDSDETLIFTADFLEIINT